MTVKTYWVCDGCDDQLLLRSGGGGTDWKSVTVRLEGFKGYPTCAPTDPDEEVYHLCPSCSQRLWNDAHPRQWTTNRVLAPTPSDKEQPE